MPGAPQKAGCCVFTAAGFMFKNKKRSCAGQLNRRFKAACNTFCFYRSVLCAELAVIHRIRECQMKDCVLHHHE
jgi:hypothetical protein